MIKKLIVYIKWFRISRLPIKLRRTINQYGFTLVELLVVVTIIAVLVTIGAVLFTNIQQRARDGKRQSEVKSITKALESYKVSGSLIYPAISTTWFAGGTIPRDPRGTLVGTDDAQYSIVSSSLAIQGPGVCGTVWSWDKSALTPTVPAACSGSTITVNEIVSAGNIPSGGYSFFQVCTLLEQGSYPSNLFCVANQQ